MVEECKTKLKPNCDHCDSQVKDAYDLQDPRIIQKLSVCLNGLSYLSGDLTYLENLTKLDISKNNLEELPTSVCLLKKLEHLVVNDNKLVTLPDLVGELCSLKILCLSKNQIKVLPDSLGNLDLREMYLDDNNLTDLPLSFVQLNDLKTLDVANNCLKTVPKCITNGMKRLEKLDLSFNRSINHLHPKPASNRLRWLYFKEVGPCLWFPSWLFTSMYVNFEEISFNRTQFERYDIPHGNIELRVKRLSMENCNLSDIELGKVLSLATGLQELNISNTQKVSKCNMLSNLPLTALKNKKELREIHARATGLPTIQATISEFENLTVLNLGRNNIFWLPDEICQLTNLEVLIVEGNSLITLPDNIGDMAALVKLQAAWNSLSSLPDSVQRLKSLRFLDLYMNDFMEVPESAEKIDCLFGFDIDGNYFDTTGLWIGKVSYEDLKNKIRKNSGIVDTPRFSGPRIEATENSESSSQPPSASTGNNSPGEISPKMDNEKHEFEENWDVSEDSTDEFDPNSQREPKCRRKYKTFDDGWRWKNFFDPSDLHSKRTGERVLVIQRNNPDKLAIMSGEDQFEDA
ncbi:leucine-rich repeat protein soc-2 homolog [Orussus abietinus]|uniref:leucine-rich repeat protein soc-2 homolog n=1 Tax=Orussus abietinus TaxID=222816 RepID=UPI000626D057|nr:leucine-rich repeat protein soc-2 homolog [Orussus abietinus]